MDLELIILHSSRARDILFRSTSEYYLYHCLETVPHWLIQIFKYVVRAPLIQTLRNDGRPASKILFLSPACLTLAKNYGWGPRPRVPRLPPLKSPNVATRGSGEQKVLYQTYVYTLLEVLLNGLVVNLIRHHKVVLIISCILFDKWMHATTTLVRMERPVRWRERTVTDASAPMGTSGTIVKKVPLIWTKKIGQLAWFF